MKFALAYSFRGYKTKRLKNDFVAALVVTAIAIPESLGFAAIVGLPLVTGLYCALFAPLIFAVLTSSRRVVVGADSATATLVAAGGSAVAVMGTAAYGHAIATLGILTAIILAVMAFAKFGFLANFISKPVLVGFFAGIGVQLMIGRLPELLGIEAVGGGLPAKFVYTITHLDLANPYTLLLSMVVIITALLVGKTRFPGALAGLLVGSVVAAVFGFSRHGVDLVGNMPAGLPTLVLPDFTPAVVLALIPTALSIALVIVAQGTTVIRDAGREHGERTHLDQDILAFGAANAVSALTQGFAINGSPPRTYAADMAHGRSQFVNIFMALFVGAILLFATGVFDYVPSAVLAAIVFVIGLHLFSVARLKTIYKTRRKEFVVAMTALVSVALLGVMQGVLIAVIVSLMERLYRQYHPSDQILLRDGKLTPWARERINLDYAFADEAKGLLLYRFNGSIFFENSQYFSARLKLAIRGAEQPVNSAIVDAGAIDDIDYTAVEMLRDLATELRDDDIIFGFAHVSPHLKSEFDRYGVTAVIGRGNIHPTLNQAMLSYSNGNMSTREMISQLALSRKKFVVIGGAAMEAMGLRKTGGVDIVVTEDLYLKMRDELGWQEYVQENGKCILSAHGVHAMRRWFGHTARVLARDAVIIDEVRYINPKHMINGKLRLGRAKDLEDVKLLRAWQRKHPRS